MENIGKLDDKSCIDDAAGLAVSDGYRDQISELTQGVQNANDGVSSLQIIDGGLNNISTMLDRMQTVATESASSTFSGNRNTLNNEYQQLVGEITRQASDIGLVSGGRTVPTCRCSSAAAPRTGALSLSQVESISASSPSIPPAWASPIPPWPARTRASASPRA